MARGKTLRLFLMDGEGSGRVKCTLANWTGIAYKIPRTMIDRCNDICLLNQSGIYFMFGMDENDDPVVYVGQAVSRKNGKGLLLRVQEKHNSIEYWSEAVLFTTVSNSFGPTEISYLENRFYNIAKEAGRYKVANGNDPNPGNVTEETECELEDFIDYAKIVMVALGHKVLEPAISATDIENNEPVLEMKYGKGLAKGQNTNDGFVILKGSKINPTETNSCPDHVRKSRRKYAEKIDDNWITTSDLHFSSPSGAAGFVGGASLNGKIEWKTCDGVPLKEL